MNLYLILINVVWMNLSIYQMKLTSIQINHRCHSAGQT
jgi:hypothetical protein